MTRIRWKEQIEVLGMIAIVASLVFVGLQLQQDRNLARAELGASTQDFAAMVSQELGDPDVSRAWVKMIESPEDLTVDEMMLVNSVLSSARRLFLRECYLVVVGVFVECESVIHGMGTQIFGNRYAQSWWRARSEQTETRPDPFGTRDLINDIVTSIDENSSQAFLEKTKAGL